MIINLQQLIALLPLLILIFTAVTVILSISYHRNHFFIALLTVFGFIACLFSLYFLKNIIPIHINFLFYINGYSIFYIAIIIISSISACIFSYSWLSKYKFNQEEFYLLIIFATLGAISLVISNHMASLFINIELMSLPMIGLIAYSNSYKYSLEAAVKYIILSAIASSFLLMGIAWIYSISGNLSFISIHKVLNIASFNEKLVLLFGISMMLMSLLFKLSIVPFHLWTPDIYQGTPASVLSFFVNISKISIFGVLLNLISNISHLNNQILYVIFSFFIICSILFGYLMALSQKNIKRFFGYASTSQLGYLLILLLVSKKNYLFSLESSSTYLVGYILSNIIFFGIIHLISYFNEKNDIDYISSYQGLFWSQPCLSSILILVLLSLAGIPMTLGFIGKFYILSIIIQEHLWVVGISFIIGSILSLYCYLRIIVYLFLRPLKLSQQNFNILNHWFYTPSGILICVSGITLLVLGIYPNALITLLKILESY